MKNQLVEEIEAQLGWGDGADWNNKDFQELSERIFRSTHKQLSVTTLKRVWGRAELVAQPSTATLDILSEFAGYENWRQFCQQHESTLHEGKTSPPSVRSLKSLKISGMLIALALFGLVFYAFVGDKKVKKSKAGFMSTDSIAFSFQKVAAGYPNTVIFRYDIGDMPFDSLSIQQSWDNRKRIPLNQSQGLVTATYYYPGYYLTKLLVNNEIVREKDLYIPTRGWQGLVIENEEDFVYLKAEQLLYDSSLRVTPDVLQHINEHPGSVLYLANLTDKPQVNSADFRLETEFRIAQPSERSVCQNVRLTVTGTKDIYGLQFSIPGCVGDLMFVLNKEMISGKDNDLSGFGIDPGSWVNCKLEVKGNQLVVKLNNKQVFAHTLSSFIGKIGGVQWMFEGLGEVRSLTLKDGENTIHLIQR
jgi:hypothetical protein